MFRIKIVIATVIQSPRVVEYEDVFTPNLFWTSLDSRDKLKFE